MKPHSWRISDSNGDSYTHGYEVACTRCGLELVPCADLVPTGPRARFYLAGRSERYRPSKHGDCPDLDSTSSDKRLPDIE